ncbi:MAG: sulfite exporter TauE/SafE family protein [Burkholderiales bacterium]
MDPAELAALGAIAFAGALIFGLTGFGSALITIPLASHLVPLPFALALFALADLVSAFGVGLENPRNAVRGEWTRLVPMILAGTAVGVTALVNLPRAVGMLLLGVFVLSFALYSLVRRSGARVISARWAWLAGFAGGITSALFGAGGPPYAIYLSQRGLTKEQFRATLGFATMTSISLRVLAFLVTGVLLDLRVWAAAAVAAPCAFAGIAVSRRVFRRISRGMLLRAVTAMLLASGASLIVRALG